MTIKPDSKLTPPMFSSNDLETMKSYHINPEDVEAQLNYFRNGFPPMDIVRNVSPGDGIFRPDESQKVHYIEEYEKAALTMDIQKFVPASGAATRMFKSLYAYLNETEAALEDHPDVKEFMHGIRNFAFYDDLKNVLKESGKDLETLLDNNSYKLILEYVLEEKGLNYGFLPKGLIKFHRYEEYSRTAAEEHLVEAALYAVSKGDQAYVHFTVSPQHRELFREHMAEVKGRYENKYGIKYNISYSEQNPGTNTIAVDFNNEPFRQEGGEILFRPGGHGALLENLNSLSSDLVMIKNIDNIVPDHLKDTTVTCKKLIAGVLVEKQLRVFGWLHQLEKGEGDVEAIKKFLADELCYVVPEEWAALSQEEQKEKYLKVLNRPIRVCGIVINTGAAGGGPFWVRDANGGIQLQIIETPQINQDDPEQVALTGQAGYFNPTDVVCGIRNYKGEPFDLMKFRDPDTGFITEKSLSGEKLKALELPGLWNGSMADWITLFVEVPEETFNPVKSVNDLLLPAHQ